jgi:enoyl-CoA hydratase
VDEGLIRYSVDGPVGFVTLNRPQKLNAISRDLMEALDAALVAADTDPATAVVVLRAEGRSFCVGYDLGASHEKKRSARDWHGLLNRELEFECRPWSMRKPVIASVQGHALGGGCELVMMCDLIIAADDAAFGEPEIRFGVSGPLFVMPWLIGRKAANELLYFGDTINAERAMALGMINRVVPRADLDAATKGYAQRLALVGVEALALTKAAVREGAEVSGIRAALQAGANAVVSLYADPPQTVADFWRRASTDGVSAAVKWRNAQFKEE